MAHARSRRSLAGTMALTLAVAFSLAGSRARAQSSSSPSPTATSFAETPPASSATSASDVPTPVIEYSSGGPGRFIPVRIESTGEPMTVSFAQPRIHIYGRPVHADCVTPCQARVRVGSYRIFAWNADRVRVSSRIDIVGNSMTLRVHPGRSLGGGAAVAITGAALMTLGATIMPMPWLSAAFWRTNVPPGLAAPWLIAGGTLMAAGTASLIAGAVIIAIRRGGIEGPDPLRMSRRLEISPIASVAGGQAVAGVFGRF